ncbi:MAG: hypothetical protein U0Q15_00895 [Kineosporiaceae bacterium]
MKRRRVLAVAVAVTAVASLSACTTTWTPDEDKRGASPMAPAPTDNVKKPIQGLIDRQGMPKGKNRQYVSGFVVKVRWADLQPSENGSIASPNAIDAALNKVRDPSSPAYGLKLKVRVFAGVDSPEWSKRLGGAPVKYVNTKPGSSVMSGTLPRFWTTAYGTAYAALQSKLATKYDSVAEIREVTVSRCSTLYDEMFARQLGSAQNTAAMRAAGYATDLDKKCIKEAISAHAVWKRTISDVAFGPLPVLEEPDGDADMAFTLQMMTYCRQVLDDRCGLQNNSLSMDKMATPRYVKIYDEMRRLGPPSVIQTATNARIGEPRSVLSYAVGVGVNSVELPQGYDEWSGSVLATAKGNLSKNALP